MESYGLYLEKMKVKILMNGREFIIDANRTDGNAPMDTIISALLACTTISITTILKRMHENFENFEVHANWEQEPEPPRIFKKIELNYSVSGKVSEGSMEKAINLTFQKYSPSAVMLQRVGIELKHSFKIEQ
ncbi:MAG: OsmC family protein [Thermoplasmata archaeon]